MTERHVLFRIIEMRGNGKYTICVYPTVTNIYRTEGGEEILLAIAANCIRTIAKTDGLERAMERFHKVAVTHTKIKKDKWPWE